MSAQKAQELYKSIIIEHYKKPYARLSEIPQRGRALEKFRSCGDRITMWVETSGETIEEIGFVGEGCSISIASASIIAKAFEGQTIVYVKKQIEDLTSYFDHLTQAQPAGLLPTLSGDFEVFQSLAAFQTRVACARLSVDALRDLLKS